MANPIQIDEGNLTGNVVVSRYIEVLATLAQVNAGHELVTAVTGKVIQVTNVNIEVIGTWTTGTNVNIESDDGTPSIVCAYAQADLTNGAVLDLSDATAKGPALVGNTETGSAIRAINTGSDFGGGTSILFGLTYNII